MMHKMTVSLLVSKMRVLLTTARLVRIARINHPLVIGGICVTQASIPTGIVGCRV